MKTQPKKLSDYTDRELMERILNNSRVAAEAAEWMKTTWFSVLLLH
jgi:hypothetical protein